MNLEVPPVKLPLRKIPLAVKEDLENELKRWEHLGVIVREERPTEWVSSLVVARKANGKIRVCIDPKPLNTALKRTLYPLPVLDNILPRQRKARIFSICDISSGYWHVSLDEQSSQWDVFTKFRAKLPAGRTDWRAFQLAFILYGGRRRRKFGGPLWKEKRAIMLCHRFWVFLGALQKRIHVNLSWSPQEQRVFEEETFTD